MSAMTLFARLTRSSRSALRYGSRVSAVAALAALGTMAACGGAGDATGPGGGGGGGGGGGVASVSVSPSTGSIAVGATTTLAAAPLDASGNAVSGATVTWGTSDANIATVSTSGVVTGVGAGTATISATSGTVKGTATITVTPAPVASVTLAASQTSLLAFVADSVHLGTANVTATLKDAGGNVLTGRSVTWASSDTNVVQVSTSGVVQAIGNGTATITATSGGVSGSIQITSAIPSVAHISAAPVYDTVHVGQTATLVVHLYDASMNEIVPVSHGRAYPTTISTTIAQTGDVISADPASLGYAFRGDSPGDAVVTFADLSSGLGFRVKITVIP